MKRYATGSGGGSSQPYCNLSLYLHFIIIYRYSDLVFYQKKKKRKKKHYATPNYCVVQMLKHNIPVSKSQWFTHQYISRHLSFFYFYLFDKAGSGGNGGGSVWNLSKYIYIFLAGRPEYIKADIRHEKKKRGREELFFSFVRILLVSGKCLSSSSTKKKKKKKVIMSSLGGILYQRLYSIFN